MPVGMPAGMPAGGLAAMPVSGLDIEPQTAVQSEPKREPVEPEVQLSKGDSVLVDLRDKTTYKLGLRYMTIGRGAENDIVLNDANASRAHARMTQDATGTWKINDLGSTNGTLLNQRFIQQALLHNGDQITIGLTTLEFRA